LLAGLAVGLGALQVIGAGPVSAAPGDITEFALSPDSGPLGVATGPDGNLWFTEGNSSEGGRIGRITPSGTITEFSSGTTADGGDLPGIAAGSDGNLWFTDIFGGRIGRITPSGTTTVFSSGITTGGGPDQITAGPDGNVWFTEYFGGRIGRISPDGAITEYPIPTAHSRPFGITTGRDGNVWFTEQSSDRIGRITPSGAITEFSSGITTDSNPLGIAAGSDGNLWFAEGRGRIGRITLTGAVTEFSSGITSGSDPEGIAAGSDGNLWFTDEDHQRIGRITPSGTVTEFSSGISAHSRLQGITAGPDGSVWFTETIGDRIGRLELPPAPWASLRPAGHDFGEQVLATTSGAQQFTLTNSGTARLTVDVAGISGAHPREFAITEDHCSDSTLAPGESCAINVTFTPFAIGVLSATLTVADDAVGSPHTAALSGTGTPAASSLQLSTGPEPSAFGDPVTLTAQVSTTAPVTPTGSVTFTDGGTALGTAAVDATGTATLTSTALRGGTHEITATYSGDANLQASSATTVQHVNPAPTTLSAKPAQLVVQVPGISGLRLSARLTRAGAPVAGQSVEMRVDGVTACTATTTTDGIATCIAPLGYLLAVTLHGYTATYAGSPDYQPATGHAGLLG